MPPVDSHRRAPWSFTAGAGVLRRAFPRGGRAAGRPQRPPPWLPLVEPERIGWMLLGERPGRIPVRLIVADNEALVELAAPVRERVASRPGSAAVSHRWAQIGPTELQLTAADSFGAVSTVLRHLAVEELIILWTPAEIARFGLPVDPHAGGTGLRDWFESLGRVPKRAAAFDTRIDAPAALTGRASKGIARELRQHGCTLISDPESFLVTKDNHLEADEDARARTWGVRLAKNLVPDEPGPVEGEHP